MNQFELKLSIKNILILFITFIIKVCWIASQDSSRFLTLSKDHQKDDESLDESFCDFLLNYNDRLHSTTKVALYRAIMDAIDKENYEK